MCDWREPASVLLEQGADLLFLTFIWFKASGVFSSFLKRKRFSQNVRECSRELPKMLSLIAAVQQKLPQKVGNNFSIQESGYKYDLKTN